MVAHRSSVEIADECSQIGNQAVGLFEGSEVAPVVDVGPPHDRVAPFREAADRWILGVGDDSSGHTRIGERGLRIGEELFVGGLQPVHIEKF